MTTDTFVDSMALAESSGSARRLDDQRLDGVRLSVLAWVLILGGAVGGLLFTAIYIVEGATRAGYSAWAQPISALSLGPYGSVQQVNFVLFGALVAASAFGWRQALKPGTGASAFPGFRALAGIGLIVDGIFNQDPTGGYPPGSLAATTSAHGVVHTVFAIIAITSLALGSLVLARRFLAESAWRAWAPFAAAAGLLTIAFIALYGATLSHGAPAGLFERLAGGMYSILVAAVIVRLALQLRGQRLRSDRDSG